LAAAKASVAGGGLHVDAINEDRMILRDRVDAGPEEFALRLHESARFRPFRGWRSNFPCSCTEQGRTGKIANSGIPTALRAFLPAPPAKS